MKEIAIYFSITGYSKFEAQQLGIECFELKTDTKLPKSRMFQMVILGGKTLMKKGLKNISNLDITSYDKVIFVSPVWADKLCPVIDDFVLNNLELLKTKEVEFIFTSAGGKKENLDKYVQKLLGDIKITHIKNSDSLKDRK